VSELDFNGPSSPGCGRGKVAIVFPAQHLRDEAGATEVLRQQRNWLAAHGYAVRLIVVAPSLSPWPRRRIKQKDQAIASAGALDFDDITFVGLNWKTPRRWAAILRLLAAVLRRDWSLDADIAISDAIDAEATKLRRQTEPEFVICNYLSGLSVADTLATLDRQLLILHDWIETRPSSRITAILQEDRERLALNADEARRMTLVAPQRPCLVGIPFTQLSSKVTSLRPTPRDIAEAIGSSVPQFRPNLQALDVQPSSHAVSSDRHTGIDLLFVGGAHIPNQSGITAFVHDCFIPFLSARGVNLVIAGAVGNSLNFESPPGLIILGRVQNLKPLYESARLVIVPLLTGTGISIKTLEAIAMHKPVLATPVGLRGLEAGEDVALPPPFDRRWADQILNLLHSPERLAGNRAAVENLTRGQSLGEALAKFLDVPSP
jgi:hypothetical protein